MRKMVLFVACAGALLGSSAAFAATATTGTIKALDPKACTITLDSGKVYNFPAKCDFSKESVGQKVTVSWTSRGGKLMVSKLQIAKVAATATMAPASSTPASSTPAAVSTPAGATTKH